MNSTSAKLIHTIVELNTLPRIHNVPFVIWCCWLGQTMNENRKLSFKLMQENLGVPLCLITEDNLQQFIIPEHPLHQAFKYLSDVHKSDYLRIYLLHHFGGGWHDIKATGVRYAPVWEEFSNPNTYLIGKPEIEGGPAQVHDEQGLWMPNYWKDLVATNRWVGRANTRLSISMYENINLLLYKQYKKLRWNPSRKPYDHKKQNRKLVWLRKLLRKDYPLQWTVFGDIFHPLNYQYRQFIMRTLPFDNIENLGLKHR